MEVEIPTEREDVDSLWVASRNALRQKPVEEKEHRDAATKQADHDRNSRTNVVLAWVGTNMCVITVYESMDVFYLSRSTLKLIVFRDLSIRLMIVVFTSTAFTDWVAEHVNSRNNATFNPYLAFLFFAL